MTTVIVTSITVTLGLGYVNLRLTLILLETKSGCSWPYENPPRGQGEGDSVGVKLVELAHTPITFPTLA